MKAILATILLVALAGCVTTEVNREWTAQDNVFNSPSVPDLRVECNKDFVFCGNFKSTRSITHTSGGKDNITYYYYLFGKIEDDKTISQGVKIQINEIDRGYWYTEAFKKTKLIDSGVQEIDGKNYDYYVGSLNTFNKKERKKISEWGYKVKSHYLNRVYVRVCGADSRFKVYIGYFESTQEIPNWKDTSPELYSDDQRKIIAKFLETSKVNMKISNSSFVSPASDDSNGKLNSTEEKLRKLKSFYEKGLITEEEYKSKKSEILDNIN